jgi:hypothetical protein
MRVPQRLYPKGFPQGVHTKRCPTRVIHKCVPEAVLQGSSKRGFPNAGFPKDVSEGVAKEVPHGVPWVHNGGQSGVPHSRSPEGECSNGCKTRRFRKGGPL